MTPPAGPAAPAITCRAVPTAERAARERQLLTAGVALPLGDLEVWQRVGAGPAATLYAIHDRNGTPIGGFAVRCYPVRSLPGHHVLRVERLGDAVPAGTEPAVAACLLAVGRRDPLALRLGIEVYSRDEDARERLMQAFVAAGFQVLPDVRVYQQTLAIPVQREDAELLASFSSRTRRHLRAARNHGFVVSNVTDPAQVPELQALHAAAYRRTGGRHEHLPWLRLLAAAREAPDRFRIVGVSYLTHDAARLVSFATLSRHGRYVTLDAAGSERIPGPNIPVQYPAIWEALCWARAMGSDWLDFGGISPGTTGSEDPLGGISDFKRGFGGEEVTVGVDLSLELAPMRSALAKSLGRLASRFTRA